MCEFMLLDKTPKAQLSLSQRGHRAAHLSSEASTSKAMSAIHALQNWIAEMMVPP
jgi:hypothetical protein